MRVTEKQTETKATKWYFLKISVIFDCIWLNNLLSRKLSKVKVINVLYTLSVGNVLFKILQFITPL